MIEELRGRGKKFIRPSSFKSALGEYYPFFRNTQPHDAHEFLLVLLDALVSENHLSNFKGCLHLTFTCLSCGSVVSREEPFKCLQLSALISSVEESICDILKADKVNLSVGWRCSVCKEVGGR